MPTKSARAFALAMLLPLILLLQACATKPADSICDAPIPTLQVTPVLPPALAKLPPRESYSLKAQQRIQQWQNRLTNSETK